MFRTSVTSKYVLASVREFEDEFRKAAAKPAVFGRWQTETGSDGGEEEYQSFVQDFLADFHTFAEVRGSEIVAYRILIIDDIEDFMHNLRSKSPKPIGDCWTWHKGAVFPVDGLGDQNKAWVVVARVPKSIVSFGQSLILNAQFPHERELRLDTGSVKVMKVYKFKDESMVAKLSKPISVRT
jgi:hypothetical protein